MGELTAEELEFVIWALGFVEGAASEMDDDATGRQAYQIAEKLKASDPPLSDPPDLKGYPQIPENTSSDN